MKKVIAGLWLVIAFGAISLGYIAPSQFPSNPPPPTGSTALLSIDGGMAWGAVGSVIVPGPTLTVYQSDGGVAYFGPVPSAALTPGANLQVLESDGGVAYFGPLPSAALTPGANLQVLESDGGVAYFGPVPSAALTPGANLQVLESDGGVAYFGPVPSAALTPGANLQVLESDGGVAYFGPVPSAALTPGANLQVLESDGGVAYFGPVPSAALTPGANLQVLESDGGVAYFGPVPSAALTPGAAGTELVSDGGLVFFSPCSGDITCSASNPANKTVVSIAGSSPVSIFPNNLLWAASANGIKLSETQAASGSGNPAELFSQESASGSGGAGGDIRLTLGNGDGAGAVAASVKIRRDEGSGTVVDTARMALDTASGNIFEEQVLTTIPIFSFIAKTTRFGSTVLSSIDTSAGAGTGIINVSNAATNPTSNPATSFYLYSSGGASFIRGSGGLLSETSGSGSGGVNSESMTLNNETYALRTVSTATATTIATLSTASTTSGHITADIVCRAVTAPSAGAIGDTWAGTRTISYRNVSGTVTSVGTIGSVDTDTDTSMASTAASFTPSGTTMLLQMANVSTATVDCQAHVTTNVN